MNQLSSEVVEVIEVVSPRSKDSSIEAPSNPSTRDESSPENASLSTPDPSETLADEATICHYCCTRYDSIVSSSTPFVDAYEEEDVLNFREIRSSWKSDKPLVKLADFRVYDEARHLCPFDGNLIKKNVSLYFSGFVKPGDSKTDDRHDGYPCEDMGPITEWWFIGFSLGEKVVCGISSELADYCLTQPLEEYAPFVADLNEKVYVAKTVIDFLEEAMIDTGMDISYEALLSQLQRIESSDGFPKITEDILLKNGVFICDQITKLDANAENDDSILSWLSCVGTLSQKVNFDLLADFGDTDSETETESSSDDEDDDVVCTKRSKKSVNKDKLKDIATTPMVREIFENFFKKSLNCCNSLQNDMELGILASEQLHSTIPTELESQTFHEYRSGEKILCITLPITLLFEFVKLNPLDEASISFYLNKYKKQTETNDFSAVDSNHLTKFVPESMKRKYDCDIQNDESINRRKKTRINLQTNIQWVGEPIKKVDGFDYFQSVVVNDTKVAVADFVSSYKTNSVARVKYLWENNDGEKLFHAHWFTRSLDTILGEVGHPNEVFESNCCEDVLLDDIYQVVDVQYIKITPDWLKNGNVGLMEWLDEDKDPSSQLFYQKKYCEKTARFKDVDEDVFSSSIDCYNCAIQRVLVQDEIPCSEEKSIYNAEKRLFSHSVLCWRKQNYRIGSCVFLNPSSIFERVENIEEEEEEKEMDYDEEIFPEKYRKSARKSIREDNIPFDPFEIGYLTAIWSERQEIRQSSDVKVEVKKFYRPHNTSLSSNVIRKLDLNLIYWSDDDCTVNFSEVQGKCWVSYIENLNCSLDEWYNGGPYRFYFSQAYNKKFEIFEAPSEFAKKIGKLDDTNDWEHVEVPPEYPFIKRPLRSLDVFAGCGGLSEGLRQAKVAECLWAIEIEPNTAKSFCLNNPNATVYNDDSNELLRAMYNREEKTRNGISLPKPGDVEFLCGGPPCQGFSGMNRNPHTTKFEFQNALVANFLSYCDYLRPRFFLLENVRNFAYFKKNRIHKLVLLCLIKMGYQVTFACMQSGRYGIPQTRRRIIILAAAPGEVLPLFPEPLHTFSLSGYETVTVEEQRFIKNCNWTNAAPYRMISIYDVLSDLHSPEAGESNSERPYDQEPITHVQRLLRSNATMLTDHVTKRLSPLDVKRVSFISKNSTSDWRDLPNIVVKLADGTYTKRLQYTHHNVRKGKTKSGALRGVCKCANFRERTKCKISASRPTKTIIPWCLSHRADFNNNYESSYGRLSWDGYFSTLFTNPHLRTKHSRIIHPQDDRIISVREYARAQGFPDHFKFCGFIHRKYQQIGNAVAPPLAKAIGLEIAKAIYIKEHGTGS